MAKRRLSLTVALDFPRTSAEVKVFTQALEAEFAATKEKILRGPILGLGITCYSRVLIGNKDIPRVWRRLLRHLQYAHVVATTADVWCYGARVYELERDDESPRIDLVFEEG